MPPDPLDPSPRWSVERRLAFIAERLSWERRINRTDLVERFGVSPNQATFDLKRFAELHPAALVYDGRARAYRAGPGWSRPDARDASALLRDLRLVAEGVLTDTATALVHAPALALAEPPLRAAPAPVLAAVLAAIRERRALSAVYRSFSHPEPRRRVLEPHALVFDGFRWHARARDAKQSRFKDFVLGRLSDLEDAGEAQAEASADEDWRTLVSLRIGPHPGLTPAQRAAVEVDYGMRDGELALTCRRAVVYYVKRRLGLTEGAGDRAPNDQHVVLLSQA